MEERRRILYRLVSRLLEYPGEELLSVLPGLEKSVEEMEDRARSRLSDFLYYLCKTPLIALQEEYTRTFDLNPGTSLNLTFHKWGDNEDRSKALLELKKLYHDAGFDICGGELPDCLPVMLEFLSVNPQSERPRAFSSFADEITLLASRLRERLSPYAGLIEIIDSEWRRSP